MTRPSTFSTCGTLPAKGVQKRGWVGPERNSKMFRCECGEFFETERTKGVRGGTSEKCLQRGRVTDFGCKYAISQMLFRSVAAMDRARQTSPEFAYLSHPPPYLKLMTRSSTFSACGTLPARGGRKELKNFPMRMWRILRNGTNEGAGTGTLQKSVFEGGG
ncbi:hypothetical protein CEXT_776421 [Caerostris extrusa]|uniref:Uncharacterized protein n=1 Tax=Caerostris extrusa TaxID=172846 RepID=A0AAV4MQM9_CAEEX|nr:hypothetical protein CEXT_776421 [Caerostris extrusa]